MKLPQTLNAASIKCVQTSLIAAVLMLMSGCSHTKAPPKPKPLALEIQPVEGAESYTIHVWVGAASQYDNKLREEKDLDKLITSLKDSAGAKIKSFQLAAGATRIDTTDPLWKVWGDEKGAEYLVVVADLPRHLIKDPALRRAEVPLDPALWKHLPKPKTVHIQIAPPEVKRVETPHV
jgi:hypothetical protein